MKKTQLTFMHSQSLMGLIDYVNDHNKEFPDSPIVREDIVQIIKEDDTFIMLYYV